MNARTATGPPPTLHLVIALGSVYLIWGSTYLAIRVAIETIPPFLMLAVRYIAAGLIMYVWGRITTGLRPTREQWIATAVVGGLLLVGGNGAVAWSEQHIPSGLAALLVAMSPLWMVLFDWARPGGVRPRPIVAAGILLGLVGVVVLVGPGEIAGGGRIDLLGAAVVLAGTLMWAFGSIYSRGATLPASPVLSIGMQMFCGGAIATVVSLVAGEQWEGVAGGMSTDSLLALVYLVIFGSLIGFSAYAWLLRSTTVARASTYAYVNPVVAVLLGWWLLDEPITGRTVIAALTILGGVVLISLGSLSKEQRG